MDRQFFLLVFLDCEQKLLWFIRLRFTDCLFTGAFPFRNENSLTEQLTPFVGGHFRWFATKLRRKFLLHSNHKFLLVKPEQLFSFLHFGRHFLQL
jgi:hypothetical protein